MKKRYTSKSAKENSMASDLSNALNISFADAKSRIARLKLNEELREIQIDGEIHNIKFYITPEKWLGNADRLKSKY